VTLRPALIRLKRVKEEETRKKKFQGKERGRNCTRDGKSQKNEKGPGAKRENTRVRVKVGQRKYGPKGLWEREGALMYRG